MIFVFIVQVVVGVLILGWLLKRKAGEPFSKKTVAKFFGFGALALIVALAVSMILPIKDDTFFGLNPLIAGFLTAFLTAALFEECIKYVFLRLAFLKKGDVVSWLDITIAAGIFGIGFTLMEDLQFAISNSSNLVRAFLPGHVLFQIIMGYFYGKARETGQKKYDVLSLVIPIFVHTLYDAFIISLMVAIGNPKTEVMDYDQLMQLPYAGYIIPLTAAVIITAIALIIALICVFIKINKWSKQLKSI